MTTDNQAKYTKAIWQITEVLRDAEQFDTALSEALTVIIDCIGCEAGSVWFLDKKSNRVQAAFNVGTDSIAGFSVENGQGIVGGVPGEGIVVAVGGDVQHRAVIRQRRGGEGQHQRQRQDEQLPQFHRKTSF